MFSRKRWVHERFCAADVKQHTVSITHVASGARTRAQVTGHRWRAWARCPVPCAP